MRIDIAYCGVCHSDVHQARDEWGGALATNFPCMPGHEIAGTIAEVGERVSKFSIGDRVGVGCMIDSCGCCRSCQDGLEQFCLAEPTWTYNSRDEATGEVTFGGFSNDIVVAQRFVLRIPDSIELRQAAPLLCAGITAYSPLRHWKIGHGHRVGVAGIGGLGHMAIQFAKALGATVVALTRSAEKADRARSLGASHVIVMTDTAQVEKHAASLDFILSTIPTAFDVSLYLALARRDGTLVSVGTLERLAHGAVDLGAMCVSRQTIGGSLIGGIAETQEMLTFCAECGIRPETELIGVDSINHAFDRIVDGDVRFRYVVDLSTLPALT